MPHYWNGVYIPGETNRTLVIDNAQTADSGSYQLSVENEFGSVDSEIIKLVIHSATTVFADRFADRIPISGAGEILSGDNLAATDNETQEPVHANKPGGRSVWFKWQAPADGVATITTRGSGLDTLLGIYTGTSMGGLTRVASDDDAGGYGTSRTSFPALSGTQYAIAIDTFGGATGQLVCGLSFEQSADDVPTITGNPSSRSVQTNGTTTTFTVAAVNRFGNRTNLTYQWFFDDQLLSGETGETLRVTDIATADVGGYRAEARIGLRQVPAQVAVLEIGPEAEVWSKDKFEEQFVTDDASGGAGTASAGRPRIRRAVDAIGLRLRGGAAGTQRLNNRQSRKDLFEPVIAGRGNGRTRWFPVIPEVSGPLQIDTEGSQADTVMSVFTGRSITSLEEIVSDRNGSGDQRNARVTFTAIAGRSYMVAVDSENGAPGQIKLNWRMATPAQVPVIAVQPTNTIVVTNTTVTFRVLATGEPAPTYQWLLNGSEVSGATAATLTIDSASSADAGIYLVEARNSAGTNVSSAATLRVIRPFELVSWVHSSIDQSFRFGLAGDTNVNLVIEVSTNIVPGSWKAILTTNSASGAVDYLDVSSPSFNRRFYRVRLLP